MWKLKNVKKDFLEKYIFVGEENVVGRKDCSFLISNDPSVSRKHAVLYVKHPEENLNNPSKSSALFMRDEGSKYGTFKNGARVTSEVELSDNDIVKFGQFDSEYKVCKTPLVVTTSCLENSAKKQLKASVHYLGGSFTTEWHPTCTHLVMSDVKITVKALCCLVSLKPIVTPMYFDYLKKSLKSSSVFLLPNKFIPPIGEALISKDEVSFDVNPKRKQLFKNKTFFFLDEKQFKKLHLGIVLGGGEAVLLNKESFSTDILLREKCCVIEPMKEFRSTQELNDMLQPIRSTFEEKSLRMIPESDIGLSVAYCSTDKFTNPHFKMVETLLSQKMQSQTLTQREVYVPDTQEQTVSVGQKPKRSVADCISSLHFSTFRSDAAEDMDVSEVPLSAQVKNELDDLFDDIVQDKVDSPARGDDRLQQSPLPLHSTLKTPKQEKSESKVRNETTVEIQKEASPPPRRSGRRQKESVSSKSADAVVEKIEDIECDRKENILPPQKKTKSKLQLTESRKRKESTDVTMNEEITSPPRQKIEQIKPKEEPASQKFNGFHESEENLPRNLAKVEFASLICRRPVVETQTLRNSNAKNFKKFKKVHPKRGQALPRIIGAHELVAYDKVVGEIANENWDEPSQEVSQPVRGEFDW